MTGPGDGRARLIGRDAPLAELARLVRAAGAGAGGVAVVEGDAGIGKSALLDALAREAAGDGALVLRGRAWEEGGAPAFWPWIEVATAGAWDIAWDGVDDTFRLFQQVAAAARAAAMDIDGPLLVVLDDLHAADADTQRLTRYVARAIDSTAVALVVATRPGPDVADLARLGLHVALGPLGHDAADALVDRHAGEQLDAATRARVLAAAEGNPLLLGELVRSAISGRPVAASILGTVAPAVARLGDRVRELAETAAVLGRTFDPARLARVTGGSPVDVLAELEPLRRAGVLSIGGQPPVATFAHQLVRDVLYDDLPAARRAQLHAAVAATIPDDGDPEALADRTRHLLAAVPVVDPAVAADAARRAAAHARARGAHGDAAALAERALALSVDAAERVDLLLDIGTDLRAAGRVADASTRFDEAIALADAATDDHRLALAVLGRTELVGWGRADELLPLVDVTIARLGDAQPGLRVRLLARRAALRATGTELDAALVDARAALAAARALGPGHDETLADALATAHRCCWGPAQLAESLRVGAELLAVTAGLDDDRHGEALLAAFIDQLRAGDVRAADAALARFATFATRTGRPRDRFFLDSRRAMRAFMDGRLAEGELLIERARDLGEQIEEPDAVQVFHGARMVVVDELQEPADTLAAAHFVESLALAGEPRLNLHAAHSYLRAGELDAARTALARLHRELPALTPAHLSLFDLCLAAEVAAACGERAIGEELWSALTPFAGASVVNAGGVTFGGVVDEYLAGLAVLLDRPGHDDLLRRAIGRYEAMGAAWFESRAARRLGTTDAAPSALSGAARRVELHHLGDHWELVFEGRRSILREARGLHHLRVLLGAPGHEVAATELVGGTAARELASREAHQALLDDRAKAAYRQRVRALQDELDEADARADVERSTRARAELDDLLAELRRAAGLGGRDRLAGSSSERARVTARKAIAAAIERIEQVEPALGRALRTSVRTGAWCSYTPDPLAPLTWQVS